MWKKIALAAAFVVTLGAGYSAGLLSYRFNLFPIPQLVLYKSFYFSDTVEYRETSGRECVPCRGLAGPRTAVVLTSGQSNAGNYGEVRYKSRRAVFSLYRGRCYRAEDPLPGASGVSGSLWCRLGDRMIEAGICDRVVLVPTAIGTTTIDLWAPGGPLNFRIARAAKEARDAGLPVTHFFWVQGGSERRGGGDATRREYIKNFKGIVRTLHGAGARPEIYIVVTTYNGGAVNQDVRAAQMELTGGNGPYRRAVDLDALIEPVWRYEAVHLSGAGLDRAAAICVESMKAPRKAFTSR